MAATPTPTPTAARSESATARRAQRKKNDAHDARQRPSTKKREEPKRTILPYSQLRSNVQQVRLAERVLRVARVELDDALERVVRAHVERERLLEHEEGEALRAGRGRERAGVLEEGAGLGRGALARPVETSGRGEEREEGRGGEEGKAKRTVRGGEAADTGRKRGKGKANGARRRGCKAGRT